MTMDDFEAKARELHNAVMDEIADVDGEIEAIAQALRDMWDEGHNAAVMSFAEAILHGDAEHKAWLIEAAVQFTKDGTVPPPRGLKVEKPET